MPLLIDQTGIAIQTSAEIAAERANQIRVATGNAALQFDGDGILGQHNSALSDREASIQEQFLGAYQAAQVQSAAGAQLDGLVPIGGLAAKDPTHSTIDAVYLGGTTAAVAPVGMLLGIPSLSPRFALDATVTLAAAIAWAVNIAYVIGDVRKANSQVWLCTVAGTSAAAGAGPTGTTLGMTFNDNGVIWHRIAAGDGWGLGSAHASDIGPVTCAAFGLLLIVTPEPGIASCINFEAAHLGTLAENDAELRLRYAKSFHEPGNGTTDAIFAHLDALDGVAPGGLVVYSNRTLFPDASKGGLPGKCVWAIIDGTALAFDIASTLYGSVVSGIQIGWSAAPNAVAYNYTNSQGQIETLYWSTPGVTLVDVVVTLAVGNAGYTALLSALTGPIYSYFNSRAIGDDVQCWQLVRAIGDVLIAAGANPDTLLVTLNGGVANSGNVAGVYNKRVSINSITVVPA